MTSAEIKSARDSLRMSQEQFAKRLDVDRRTVQRWEHGDAPVPHVVALAIAHLACERKERR